MGNRSVLPGKFTNGMLSLYHDKVKKPRRIKKSSLPESRLRKNHRERYSSDSTGSSHSVAVSSPGTSTETCENQPSRAVPVLDVWGDDDDLAGRQFGGVFAFLLVPAAPGGLFFHWCLLCRLNSSLADP